MSDKLKLETPRLRRAIAQATQAASSTLLEGHAVLVIQEYLNTPSSTDYAYIAILERASAEPISAIVVQKCVSLLKRFLPWHTPSVKVLHKLQAFCSEKNNTTESVPVETKKSLEFLGTLVSNYLPLKRNTRDSPSASAQAKGVPAGTSRFPSERGSPQDVAAADIRNHILAVAKATESSHIDHNGRDAGQHKLAGSRPKLLFQYRPYTEQESLELQQREVAAVIDAVCGPSGGQSVWGEFDNVETCIVSSSILWKLVMDFYTKASPDVALPLLMVLLQRAISSKLIEERVRAFDILYNLSMHSELLYASQTLWEGASQEAETEEDTSDGRGNDLEAFRSWLRQPSFQLLSLLTQQREQAAAVWESALGCLLHFVCHRGQLDPQLLLGLEVSVVDALLLWSQRLDWSSHIRCHLLRMRHLLLPGAHAKAEHSGSGDGLSGSGSQQLINMRSFLPYHADPTLAKLGALRGHGNEHDCLTYLLEHRTGWPRDLGVQVLTDLLVTTAKPQLHTLRATKLPHDVLLELFEAVLRSFLTGDAAPLLAELQRAVVDGHESSEAPQRAVQACADFLLCFVLLCTAYSDGPDSIDALAADAGPAGSTEEDFETLLVSLLEDGAPVPSVSLDRMRSLNMAEHSWRTPFMHTLSVAAGWLHHVATRDGSSYGAWSQLVVALVALASWPPSAGEGPSDAVPSSKVVPSLLAGTSAFHQGGLIPMLPAALLRLLQQLPQAAGTAEAAFVMDVRAALVLMVLACCASSTTEEMQSDAKATLQALFRDSDTRIKYYASMYLLHGLVAHNRQSYLVGLHQLILQAQQMNDEQLLENHFLQLRAIGETRLMEVGK